LDLCLFFCVCMAVLVFCYFGGLLDNVIDGCVWILLSQFFFSSLKFSFWVVSVDSYHNFLFFNLVLGLYL